MKEGIKNLWHEANAFLSGFLLFLSGTKAQKNAAKPFLFSSKFINQKRYTDRIANMNPKISEVGKFKRFDLNGFFYYWPSNANLDAFFLVLAESLLVDHPHYYNSGITSVEKGDRVLDIGACEGAFALQAATVAKEVISIEPSYVMGEAINLAAKDNSLFNVKVIAGLLGSVNKKLGFFENVLNPEASLILDAADAKDFRDCWTLDTFIDNNFPDGIEYIKCDAEGADFDILKSGIRNLLKYKPKIAVAAYHTQHDFKNIGGFLESIGYIINGQGLFYSAVLHKCYPVLLKAH